MENDKLDQEVAQLETKPKMLMKMVVIVQKMWQLIQHLKSLMLMTAWDWLYPNYQGKKITMDKELRANLTTIQRLKFRQKIQQIR